jgi:hypothetical protein
MKQNRADTNIYAQDVSSERSQTLGSGLCKTDFNFIKEILKP